MVCKELHFKTRITLWFVSNKAGYSPRSYFMKSSVTSEECSWRKKSKWDLADLEGHYFIVTGLFPPRRLLDQVDSELNRSLFSSKLMLSCSDFVDCLCSPQLDEKNFSVFGKRVRCITKRSWYHFCKILFFQIENLSRLRPSHHPRLLREYGSEPGCTQAEPKVSQESQNDMKISPLGNFSKRRLLITNQSLDGCTFRSHVKIVSLL